MEIIQTYMSDDTEVCVISDGTTLHLADKNDIEVDSPKVGSVVLPSQMKEVYLEIPITVVQEMTRRSEVYVEPDAEEESSDEEEEDEEEEEEEEEEEDALPDWKPLARGQFFEEFKALDEGVNLRVLINFPVKVSWLEGEGSTWSTTDGTYNLEQKLEMQEGLSAAVAAFNERIQSLLAAIARFTTDQNDLGHELDDDDVEVFLSRELADSKAQVAEAAE